MSVLPARPGAGGVLATAITASLAASFAAASPHPLPVALVAGAGTLAVAFGVTRRRVGAVLAGVGVVGAASLAVALSGQGSGVTAALGCGIGCFLACELGCSSAQVTGRPRRAVHAVDRDRAVYLATVVAASLVVGAVALLASRSRRLGAPAELGGLVAAGALVFLAGSLALRRGRRAPNG